MFKLSTVLLIGIIIFMILILIAFLRDEFPPRAIRIKKVKLKDDKYVYYLEYKNIFIWRRFDYFRIRRNLPVECACYPFLTEDEAIFYKREIEKVIENL